MNPWTAQASQDKLIRLSLFATQMPRGVFNRERHPVEGFRAQGPTRTQAKDTAGPAVVRHVAVQPTARSADWGTGNHLAGVATQGQPSAAAVE